MIEFLPFGNVTVACLILIATLLVLWCVAEAGLWVVKMMLAMDTEDAPEFTWKNPLDKAVIALKNILTEPSRIVQHKGKFYVYQQTDLNELRCAYWCLDGRRGVWGFQSTCAFDSKDAAAIIAENNKTFSFSRVSLLISIDLAILLLQLWFFPTIAILGISTLFFGMRYLSSKFWKGMKNHKTRLDGHDKDIDDLKSKIDGESND